MDAAIPTAGASVSLGSTAIARAEEVRARFENRPDEIPDDNNRRNLASLKRNWDVHEEAGTAGDAGVPESVREVISSSGRSLDASIQRAVEDRLGDSFGDVRIHTGPAAANACEDISARAFTVGNHIAFNSGEYDPESQEGQHLLAHELAHVRQQTDGALSMMPQEGVELEIDPDPQLEREAEETAQRVMEGGELGIQRLGQTEVHVQRVPKDQMFSALAVFGLENEGGEIGAFQREQNADRIEHVRSAIERFNAQTNEVAERRNDRALQKLIESEVAATDAKLTTDGRIEGPKSVTEGHFDHRTAKAILAKDLPTKSELQQRKQDIEDELSSELEQVALTEQQREKLDVGVEHGLVGNLAEKTAFGILKRLDTVFGAFGSMAYRVVKENWGTIDGDIVERAIELREELIDEAVQDVRFGGDSQGVGEGGHV
nr:DUF4157 domain-containing protein [Halovivax ruber]